MVPTATTLVPLYELVGKMGLQDTYWGVILPGIPGAFAIYLYKGFFDALPQAILDAARIDGASEFGIYWRVVIPICAPGLTTLGLVEQDGFYEALSERTAALVAGLEGAASAAGVPLATAQLGGMFGFFFTDAGRVRSYGQVMACDGERFKRFFHGMLDEGVYLAPSAFEAGFVSAAHSERDIADTAAAARKVMATL
jgi:hypothetical protein